MIQITKLFLAIHMSKNFTKNILKEIIKSFTNFVICFWLFFHLKQYFFVFRHELLCKVIQLKKQWFAKYFEKRKRRWKMNLVKLLECFLYFWGFQIRCLEQKICKEIAEFADSGFWDSQKVTIALAQCQNIL